MAESRAGIGPGGGASAAPPDPDPAQRRRGNLGGAAWLIADMALNIWALSIVKALGLGLPAVQLVTIRALMGLVLMAPFIWAGRAQFAGLSHPVLHLTRVGLSAVTLTASFFALPRVPLALFTTVNFTRPVLLMVMAWLLLGERISRRRWIAAGIGFLGVLVAAHPGGARGTAELWGLAALTVTVTCGTLAVIVTRRLNDAPVLVLMSFYTAGLGLLTLPFSLAAWQPIPQGDWPALLAIGLFAQGAQLCFLRAHRMAEAGALANLGYLSLVISTAVGFFVFGELPGWRFFAGAACIVAAAIWITADKRA